ncbi:hypothetical protein KJ359_004709 [Pestalotiopsis sp. 9143b]|nr:hypothetical protein KJ359_004709 [Pestalotiopsis sp. 9143b]
MSRAVFRAVPSPRFLYPSLSTPAWLLPSRRAMSSNSSIARTKSLDHLVLTVKDLDATVRFYESVLGMKHTSFASGGQERHALVFGAQKINLHVSGREFEPKAQNVQPGSGDLCFLVEDGVDDVARRLHEAGVEVLEGGGVVSRTGAKAKLRSVYIRDPDGNLVELSNETS